MPSILEAVSPSTTCEETMPWWQGPTYQGLVVMEHVNVRYGNIVCACVHWIILAWDRDVLSVLNKRLAI